jgi:hypothetical protein
VLETVSLHDVEMDSFRDGVQFLSANSRYAAS